MLSFAILVGLGSCEEETRVAEKMPISPAKADSIRYVEAYGPIEEKPTLPDTIIDASFTLEAALQGSPAPARVNEAMRLVDVKYIGFDSLIHVGQVLVHEIVEEEIRLIFDSLLAWEFPIQKVVPISKFGWSDDSSMAANNTSAFNWRKATGQARLSPHAYGTAIDINPRQNPYIKGTLVQPEGASYDTTALGTIVSGSNVVKLFEEKGWEWGGRWASAKDYQHFEKK